MKIHMQIKKARIELIPLLDLIFLVLVSFVYTFLSMSFKSGVDVTLPASSESTALKDEYIVVSFTSDKEIYIDKKIVSRNGLVRDLKKRVAANPQLKVFINADKGAVYQELIGLLDNVRQAGVVKVSLQTEVKSE